MDSESVYYSPLQLLQYIWQWHSALGKSPELRERLQDLIDTRMDLGLTPRSDARLTDPIRIRAALCFGPGELSDEVKRRYGIVLKIVNDHLPQGVGPIETWQLPSDDTDAKYLLNPHSSEKWEWRVPESGYQITKS